MLVLLGFHSLGYCVAQLLCPLVTVPLCYCSPRLLCPLVTVPLSYCSPPLLCPFVSVCLVAMGLVIVPFSYCIVPSVTVPLGCPGLGGCEFGYCVPQLLYLLVTVLLTFCVSWFQLARLLCPLVTVHFSYCTLQLLCP